MKFYKILSIITVCLLMVGCFNDFKVTWNGWAQQDTTNAWHHADGSPWGGPTDVVYETHINQIQSHNTNQSIIKENK
jgi:hypothetical protein